jgi:hypothetical protein
MQLKTSKHCLPYWGEAFPLSAKLSAIAPAPAYASIPFLMHKNCLAHLPMVALGLNASHGVKLGIVAFFSTEEFIWAKVLLIALLPYQILYVYALTALKFRL